MRTASCCPTVTPIILGYRGRARRTLHEFLVSQGPRVNVRLACTIRNAILFQKRKKAELESWPRGLVENSGLISNSSMELLITACTSSSRRSKAPLASAGSRDTRGALRSIQAKHHTLKIKINQKQRQKSCGDESR